MSAKTDKAKAQLKKLETKSDGLLRRLADSTWTVPILAALALLLIVAFVLK